MKLKGLNIQSEQDVTLLDSMYTGSDVDEDGIIDIFEIKDEKSLEQVKELSKRYQQLQAYVNKYGVKDLYKLENINGSAYARGGMGYHNINVNDTKENLLERLESIKKHGLLAAEWFGMRYENNEAPFCVSFHKITDDSFVENLKMDKRQNARDYDNFSTGNLISFFVDIENEALFPLLNPSDILDEINYNSFGHRFYDEKNISQRLDKRIYSATRRNINNFNNQINKINELGLELVHREMWPIKYIINNFGTDKEQSLLKQAQSDSTKANKIFSEVLHSMEDILKDSTNANYKEIYTKLSNPYKMLVGESTTTILNDLLTNNAEDFPTQAKLWQTYKDLDAESLKINKQLCLRIMDAPESEIESWRKQLYDKTVKETTKELKQNIENGWDYVNNHVYHVFSGVPSAFINGIALPKNLANDKDFVEQISAIFPQVMIFDREGEIIKDYPKELKQENNLEKGK